MGKIPNLGPIKGPVWITTLGVIVIAAIIIPLAVVFSRCPRPFSVTLGGASTICSGSGGIVYISGENFAETTTVEISSVDDPTITYTATVTYINSSFITAHFSAGQLAGGLYNVHISDSRASSSCVRSFYSSLSITDAFMLIFFFDPPTVYNGIQTQATIYATGVGGNLANVRIVPNNGLEPTEIDVESTNSPNRFLATIPPNITATSYALLADTPVGCSLSLPNAFSVVEQLNLQLTGVEPNYVFTQQDIGVTITVNDAVLGFEEVPRVYINPTTPTPGINAVPIESVTYKDSKTITALIPKGLPAIQWNVVVVNPNGYAGVLVGGLHTTNSPPPVITSIVPNYFNPQAVPAAVTILGENFQANATLSGSCTKGTDTRAITFSTAANYTSTRIETTITSFGGISEGAYCLVRVTNPDGSNFLFSAISTKSPSGNLDNITPVVGSTLVEGRRGHAAVAIKPTSSTMFLLALGGDSGPTSSKKSTVEKAQLDIFGNLNPWQNVDTLPAPLIWHGAVTIGKYVYVVGGSQGSTSNVTGKCWRAKVLEPSESPIITGVEIVPTSIHNNLQGGGLLQYAVSAVYNASYEKNPGGESLPSSVVPILLPDFKYLQVKLEWTAVDNAVAYRIYRTRIRESISTLQLVAEVNATTYTDNGVTPSEIIRPKTIGSIGNWAELSTSLNTPRYQHSTLVVPSPVDPDISHFYVFAGRDSNGNVLDSYEYLMLNTSVDPPAPVDTLQWAQETLNTFPAHALGGAVYATHADAAGIPEGETWLWLLAGETSSTTLNNAVKGVKITGNASLDVLLDSDNQKSGQQNSGPCIVQAAGLISILGGGSGQLDAKTSGVNARIATAGAPPALQGSSSFNSGISSTHRTDTP